MAHQLRLLGVGAREIAQWLGAFTVFGEQWGPFLITHLGGSQTTYNSSRGPNALFLTSTGSCTHTMHIHILRHMHLHIK